MGIIPAYAGSTPAPTPSAAGAGDHPRIRGEHRVEPDKAVRAAGSSPHTRGAQTDTLAHKQQVRIIPAYAGSTSPIPLTRVRTMDHPRIRGEHSRVGLPPRFPEGSSPHTRGARADERRHLIVLGIIPAYAGSTDRRRTPLGRHPDHPRIRGEHRRRATKPSQANGSSPHTRGAQCDG